MAFVKNEQDKFGFIDKIGKVVIPCQWKWVDSFSEGLAPVQDENNKWGYIDTTGKLVIPCQWKDAAIFSDGLAAVKNEQNKYGFINKKGELVIPCQWKVEILIFQKDRLELRMNKGNAFILTRRGRL